ncbi:TIGR02266 family protein [Pyxidicoccus fallax]|uniref:TIGR02266 family protein n=1 Tax=Pyxidicoccus fallax TaxID=394095 RepID=A0A848LVU9_9BACT|nr:TIGR02266 family protein [Pyxidicoccus fallax]NMO21553.1 TIGR02266 family protein [Pyxidicoccus fallax]NPC85717.1 TIGR02266 family protein [Pyxidicoccus fallax]
MTTPSPAARPPPAPSREAELTRAENELSTHEAKLAEHLARATAEASALANRLNQLRAAVARVQAEPGAEALAGEQAAALEALTVPVLDVEASREKALKAREAALNARRQAGQEMTAALKAHQEQTAQMTRAMADVETVVRHHVEAAAARTRAQQEAQARAQQEAARARQAEQARTTPQSQGTPVPPGLMAARSKGTPVPPGVPAAARHAGATATTDGMDARRNGRVRMHTSIDMRSDSNFFTGFSMDISEGGVFIATVDPVPRGTQVELDFTLPGGRPMKVTGVVRWVRESNSRTPELMPGVGVQFTGLPPEVASAISSFVTTRDPMFFPD